MSEKPWYITPASVGDDPNLCQTCVHINFEWLLENDFNEARYAHWQASRFAAVEDDTIPIKIPWISEHASFVFPDLSLGFLFEILEKSEHCSFCRLVSFAVATVYGTEPESLLKQNFQHAPYQFVFCTLTNNKRDILSGELFDLVIGLSNIQKGFHPFEQVLLHQIKDDAPTPFVGCSVGPYVNFRVIKDWLVSFGSSTPTHEALPGFRLIDVLNRNVVPIVGPGDCRYLCLRYVWGGPQRFQNVKAVERQLREPGSLSERQLPETIEDAIQLTAKSGERYLWVRSRPWIRSTAAPSPQLSIAMAPIAIAAYLGLEVSLDIGSNSPQICAASDSRTNTKTYPQASNPFGAHVDGLSKSMPYRGGAYMLALVAFSSRAKMVYQMRTCIRLFVNHDPSGLQLVYQLETLSKTSPRYRTSSYLHSQFLCTPLVP
jgi:hypothetical protein